MTAFSLSRPEIWCLATLLQLPIQPQTPLSDWLTLTKVPAVATLQAWLPDCLQSLKAKGCFQTDSALSADLIKSLTLAAVGQKHIYTALRLESHSASTRFALVGDGAVQYGLQEDQITLHSPVPFSHTLPYLLPDWLNIHEGKAELVAMPLWSFLVFQQACLLQNIHFVLNSDHHPDFSIAELTDGLRRNNRWLNIFYQLGATRVESAEALPVEAHVQQLCSIGYLQPSADGLFRTAPAGQRLAEALSDPKLVTITFAFARAEPPLDLTSAFLIGNGELFRLDFSDETVKVFRLRSRADALNWINAVVRDG